MAGTVTLKEYGRGAHGVVSAVDFGWTSTAGGAADLTTDNVYNGFIWGFKTIPSGTAAPTALYDLTIKDADSYDLANGLLADRSATVTELVAATLAIGGTNTLCPIPIVNSTLRIDVANAGASKSGRLIVYFLST